MKSIPIAVACLSLGISRCVIADVSFTESLTVQAAGGMAMFESSGESTTYISGQRSRTDSTMSMNAKVANSFIGDGKSGDITLLDQDLSIRLLPDKKQYYMMSFAESRAHLQKSMEAMQAAQSSGGVLPVSARDCRWTGGNLLVDHPPGTEKIAGISTTKHVISKRQFCLDEQTGNACEMSWTLETWQAKRAPGAGEVLDFRKSFADAMGLGDLEAEFQGPGQTLLAMFADNWSEVVGELSALDGYPLRRVMQMSMGGEKCMAASGAPIAEDGLWSDIADAGYNAAIRQSGSEAGTAVGSATNEVIGDSVGGRIGGAVVGAAASQLIGGLTGMFQKKPASKNPSREEATRVPEPVTVFRIISEVSSWSEAKIPEERFRQPAQWKKIKTPD